FPRAVGAALGAVAIVEDVADRGGGRVDVARRNEQRLALFRELAVRVDVGQDHRRSRRQRLDGGIRMSFEVADENRKRGLAATRIESVDVAVEADAIRDAELARERFELRAQR